MGSFFKMEVFFSLLDIIKLKSRGPETDRIVLAHTNTPKTERDYLRVSKLEAVTYIFPPWHRIQDVRRMLQGSNTSVSNHI